MDSPRHLDLKKDAGLTVTVPFMPGRMDGGAAIEVEGLTKRYGPHVAVDGVTFAVARGEAFVILGPNGAGKTTTVEILVGARRASSGEVCVLGYDPAADRRQWRARSGCPSTWRPFAHFSRTGERAV